MLRSQNLAVPDFPASPEVCGLLKAVDWHASPLGPPEQWPEALRSAAAICLGSSFPIAIYWGDDLALLYNDAWSDIPGTKHPWALGRPAREVWSEIWDFIAPKFADTLERHSTLQEDELLPMRRHGFVEECYFSYTFSPIIGASNRVEGVLNVVTETTYRVLNERRTRALKEVGERTNGCRTALEVCETAAEVLARARHDVPFCALYLFDEQGHARLGASIGLAADASFLRAEAKEDDAWRLPLSAVKAEGQPQLITGLAEHPAHAVWPEPVQSMIIQPIAGRRVGEVVGALVCGISPRLRFDATYAQFIEGVSNHLAAAVASAMEYEEERKRAEALAALDRAKTTFFSNVSHELRTPLTLILAPLDELLSLEGLNDDSRESLRLIQSNGARLLKLVNALLDFSRIEGGRIQVAPRPVDLPLYTCDVASNFRAAMEKAGLEYIIDCPPMDGPVLVDLDMWEKILLNLISNAFKHTFTGSVTVSLRHDNDKLVLVVRDTGTGIPAAELHNMFKRFHRVNGAASRSQEGTGIGLALVQELVRLNNGSVEVESVEGLGSTFKVSIPYERTADQESSISAHAPRARAAAYVDEATRWLAETREPAEIARTAIQQEAQARAHAHAHRPDLLIADDNSDMRDYLARLFADMYDVRTVGDGEAALAEIRRRMPDALITDVMMPKLDGFQLLRALRSEDATSTLPIIMLSARAGEEARVEGVQAGADDYVVKPFGARELIARVDGLIALSRLRAEARERERELRTEKLHVLESIADGYVELDADYRFVYLNAATERINNCRREELIGKSHWEVYPSGLGTIMEASYRKAMTEHVPVHFENHYAPWDRWFDIDVYPNARGGLSIYFRDVTERKRTIAALEEADKRKDEFLATLAHELRNPLAPIRHGLQILKLAEGVGNPALKSDAHAIMERQISHLVRLVDDLLDISRISRNKTKLDVKTLRIADVIKSAVDTVQPMLDSKRQKLWVSIPPADMRVRGDPVRLEQVFSNLLNNAVKYTPEEGELRIDAFERDGRVCVVVADSGIGIEPAMADRIFDMFIQAPGSGPYAQGGLGIGLTLVKRLVEMHGGTVTVHSAGRERGSEFCVSLPSVQTQIEAPHMVVSQAAAETVRVLVTDDNVDAAASLGVMLELMGHRIEVVHGGQDAIARLPDFKPQLILLDIGMPGMDGYETCRRLRALPEGREAMIVALTGWGQERDRRLSVDAGFDDHLTKPLDTARLAALLQRVSQGDERAADAPALHLVRNSRTLST